MVSVIIPTKELSYYLLFENLPAFVEQKYRNFEVIVLPNNPSLYTLALREKYPWIKVVATPKITRPAEKRDLGVKHAKGEIIAFIDDDAAPTADWLTNAVAVFKKHKVAAVAGPGILPKTADFWEKVFDELLKTKIGSGGFAYRFVSGKQQYVDDYPSMNFLIKKDTFNELGGFNSDYWPGEDSKLCNDLVHKLHEKILYHPDVVIYHHRRNTVKSFLKQHANYGFHRGAFFAHGDRNSLRFAYLVPTIFVAYLGVLVLSLLLFLTHIISLTIFGIIASPMIFYLIMAAVLLLQAVYATRNLLVGFGAVYILFLTHLTYGIMFVKGYIKGKTHKENIYD